MTTEPLPKWLADFQRDFAATISQPLSTRTGRFHPESKTFRDLGDESRAGRPARWGLEHHNRQYWFRLFTVMQEEYPLLASLLGYWRFNCLVHAYLFQHPPREVDLASIGLKFVDYVIEASELEGPVPKKALNEAALIDAARSKVLRSSNATAWRMSSAEAQDLAGLQLMAASTWEIVTEHWPLMKMLLESSQEGPRILPSMREHPQCWLILRSGKTLRYELLSAVQAHFYHLLCQQTVGAALTRLGQAHSSENLPALIQRWMEQSVGWNLWAGASTKGPSSS